LALVIEAKEGEAVGDRLEAPRLRCAITVVGDIGAMDDPSEYRDRWVVDLVLLDQRLKRAVAVAVGVLGPGRASKLIAPSRSA